MTRESSAGETKNSTMTGEDEKAKERAKNKHEEDIYNNFATPLIGTYLNLPREPVELKCPSCGLNGLSQVENDPKWWATEINNIIGCLFVTLCCCLCFDYIIPCKQTDRNHYCRNCGCYFGRFMKYKPPVTPRGKTN